MNKLVITICAIITLATYQYASAALFVDYTIDTDAATAGDQGLFRMGDLDLVNVETVKSTSGTGVITVLAKNIFIDINRTLNTFADTQDYFSVKTGADYSFAVKDDGRIFIGSQGSSGFIIKNEGNILEFVNNNTAGTYSNVVFTNGTNSLSLKQAKSSDDNAQLKFEGTGINSAITLRNTQVGGQVIFPNVNLVGTDLQISSRASAKFGDLKFDNKSTGVINPLTGTDFIASNIEIAGGKMQFGRGGEFCFSGSTSIEILTGTCASTTKATINANVAYVDNTGGVITAAFADANSISIPVDRPIQKAYLEDFCASETDCSGIWQYSRLMDHAPY